MRRTLLAGLLPAPVEVVEAFADPSAFELFPEERALMERAGSAERRREFATVRMCAHTAMLRLGVPAAPVLPCEEGADWARNAPRWPRGVVGAMTHCQGYRAAAVARGGAVASVGIDAEPHASLPTGVQHAVTSPEERRALAGLARSHPEAAWDRVLFSAKESVFKAWFPLTGRWLGFEDCEIALDADRGTFAAALRVPGPVVAGVRIDGFAGRWRILGRPGQGTVGTAVAVRAPAV
ncbi:4'-phosphopantetheinyl transferase family protein [Streptomyces sp. NPDC054766]